MALDPMSLASGVVGNAVNFAEQNYFANKQNNFSERMANTQYQRGAADLKAAGINPILAYASPDASPGGAGGTSSWSDPVKSSAEVNSAKQSANLAEANVRLVDEQKANAVKQGYILDAQHEGIQYDNLLKKAQSPYFDLLSKYGTESAASAAQTAASGAKSATMDIEARQQLGNSFATMERALGGVSGALPFLQIMKQLIFPSKGIQINSGSK